jgi:predicted nucleic acid-binding protein
MSCTTVRFVDTNVLLYRTSKDPEEREKTERATEILEAADLAVSVQVLQEFYVQATRKTRDGRLTHDQAVRLVDGFLRFPTADMTTSVLLAAMATRERFQVSYWDAAILEAARSLGCDVVLSEDLSEGTDYDGVRVENPFRT